MQPEDASPSSLSPTPSPATPFDSVLSLHAYGPISVVLAFLPVPELLRCRLVSREFNEALPVVFIHRDFTVGELIYVNRRTWKFQADVPADVFKSTGMLFERLGILKRIVMTVPSSHTVALDWTIRTGDVFSDGPEYMCLLLPPRMPITSESLLPVLWGVVDLHFHLSQSLYKGAFRIERHIMGTQEALSRCQVEKNVCTAVVSPGESMTQRAYMCKTCNVGLIYRVAYICSSCVKCHISKGHEVVAARHKKFNCGCKSSGECVLTEKAFQDCHFIPGSLGNEPKWFVCSTCPSYPKNPSPAICSTCVRRFHSGHQVSEMFTSRGSRHMCCHRSQIRVANRLPRYCPIPSEDNDIPPDLCFVNDLEYPFILMVSFPKVGGYYYPKYVTLEKPMLEKIQSSQIFVGERGMSSWVDVPTAREAEFVQFLESMDYFDKIRFSKQNALVEWLKLAYKHRNRPLAMLCLRHGLNVACLADYSWTGKFGTLPDQSGLNFVRGLDSDVLLNFRTPENLTLATRVIRDLLSKKVIRFRAGLDFLSFLFSEDERLLHLSGDEDADESPIQILFDAPILGYESLIFLPLLSLLISLGADLSLTLGGRPLLVVALENNAFLLAGALLDAGVMPGQPTAEYIQRLVQHEKKGGGQLFVRCDYVFHPVVYRVIRFLLEHHPSTLCPSNLIHLGCLAGDQASVALLCELEGFVNLPSTGVVVRNHPILRTPVAGMTPLMCASLYRRHGVVASLVRIPGCIVDATDSDGRTALHYACMRDLGPRGCSTAIRVCDLILSRCPSLADTVDHLGKSPIDLALAANRAEDLVLWLRGELLGVPKFQDVEVSGDCLQCIASFLSSRDVLSFSCVSTVVLKILWPVLSDRRERSDQRLMLGFISRFDDALKAGFVSRSHAGYLRRRALNALRLVVPRFIHTAVASRDMVEQVALRSLIPPPSSFTEKLDYLLHVLLEVFVSVLEIRWRGAALFDFRIFAILRSLAVSHPTWVEQHLEPLRVLMLKCQPESDYQRFCESIRLLVSDCMVI